MGGVRVEFGEKIPNDGVQRRDRDGCEFWVGSEVIGVFVDGSDNAFQVSEAVMDVGIIGVAQADEVRISAVAVQVSTVAARVRVCG